MPSAFQTRDRVVPRASRTRGFTQLIDEAHTARMQIERAALPPIKAGARGRITAPVVKAVQFLFEIVGRKRRAGVELERSGEDPSRHGPVPTLEFPGHERSRWTTHRAIAASTMSAQESNENQVAPAQRPAARNIFGPR